MVATPPQFNLDAMEKLFQDVRHELWLRAWELYRPLFEVAVSLDDIDGADKAWAHAVVEFLRTATGNPGTMTMAS